jgi:hypothetical protein
MGWILAGQFIFQPMFEKKIKKLNRFDTFIAAS